MSPHVDNAFSNEYLDGAKERLRSCLRELKTVNDRPTALATREKCKNWMTNAVGIFDELREAYDDAIAEIGRLREQLADRDKWEQRYEELVEAIEDVERGIFTFDELLNRKVAA